MGDIFIFIIGCLGLALVMYLTYLIGTYKAYSQISKQIADGVVEAWKKKGGKQS